MKRYVQSIKGMHDCLPDNIFLHNYIKKIFEKIFNSYCYNEIQTPILEETKLFHYAIGNNTDIVEKEMYSFKDKNGKNISLRPEGTVGCARLIIENNLLYEKKEQRLWYMGPMFRHEKPQKGRYRQFFQIGAEIFGLKRPAIELELILLTQRLWKKLGISDLVTLEINTIGLQKERLLYEQALILFFKQYIDVLDNNSLIRLKKNPLRILDSKKHVVQKILKKAPKLIDYLNNHSIQYFETVCRLLHKMNIKFIINKHLVRGLDYYNDTVFEWKSNLLGVKDTVCAGGRYDSLIKKLGGNNVPAAGFAIGLERLFLILRTLKNFASFNNNIDIGIIFLEEYLKIEAIILSEEIRTTFPALKVKVDFFNGNIKKKFKRASKSNINVVLLIGSKEFNSQCILIKHLKNSYQEIIPRSSILKKLHAIF